VTHVCRIVRLFPLQGCELTQVSVKPSNMGDTCLLLSFRRSAFHLCSYEIYDYVDNVTTW
jgi:hypothetical protein